MEVFGEMSQNLSMLTTDIRKAASNMSRRRREMYSGHARLAYRRMPIPLHGPGCNLEKL